MLDSFRKASKSWLAKGLLGLLIVSFGAWGIGDFITGGGDAPPAIVVGETEIGTAALRNEFNREVNQLRQRLGSDFTAEQAIQLGFLDRAIGRVVTEVAQTQAARAWSMTAPDSVVARAITNDPTFHDASGSFDRALFENVLAANGLTEARFAEQVRGDLVRQALMGPVAAGAHMSESVISDLDRHRNQARVGTVVSLRLAEAPEPTGAPDAAALDAIYQDNIEAFTAPEYRAVTAIVLGLDDARPLVSISEEAIQAEYEARLDSFTTPDTRTVAQVLADDQETAQAVADAVRRGDPLDAAAAEAGAPAPIDLGEVTRDALPAAQAEAVFALAEGGVSDPVESPFGWHVFVVRAITPGDVQTLDAVRDDIREDLIRAQASDALYDLSVDLDDTLGGGATLEEAAETLGLTLLEIPAVDRQGRSPAGTPVADLPEAPAFLNTAFSREAGETTLMQETDTGYFVLRVDGVTPAAPRPLEAVRDGVVELWARARKTDILRETAEAVQAAAREGRTLQGAAEAVGTAAPAMLPAVRRNGAPITEGAEAPPRALVQALFSLDEGETRIVETADAVHVVQLAEVRNSGGTAAETREATRDAVTNAMANDLYIVFTDALSRQQGVEINRAVIESAFQ
ncbi:peptidylprolyl isomerase [Roseospira navarrensis]|uniref:Parvulin-like PPIase n=1 Tax=Roseospira navarrensis TaxID=140058 RepID=A0A7X2D4D0_9PROT|nr:peptidylprolyl isomerase [Roseospira navarrensis]MQX36070.1 hypothetical protein [Roseospira navarrensis]